MLLVIFANDWTQYSVGIRIRNSQRENESSMFSNTGARQGTQKSEYEDGGGLQLRGEMPLAELSIIAFSSIADHVSEKSEIQPDVSVRISLGTA
jgi:hypothetical protein